MIVLLICQHGWGCHTHHDVMCNVSLVVFVSHFPGCAATVLALSFGLVQFKRGNMAKSQLAMRLRVVAQGGTVVALVAGLAVASFRSGDSRTSSS